MPSLMNFLGAVCLLIGVAACTETMLMLAAVPGEAAAQQEETWWPAAVAVGGFLIGSLCLYVADRLRKQRA